MQMQNGITVLVVLQDLLATKSCFVMFLVHFLFKKLLCLSYKTLIFASHLNCHIKVVFK